MQNYSIIEVTLSVIKIYNSKYVVLNMPCQFIFNLLEELAEGIFLLYIEKKMQLKMHLTTTSATKNTTQNN